LQKSYCTKQANPSFSIELDGIGTPPKIGTTVGLIIIIMIEINNNNNNNNIIKKERKKERKTKKPQTTKI
jgi:hypothetical protein